MYRTIEVIVYPDGRIEPLEPLAVSGPRRALLTTLDEPPVEVSARPGVSPSTAEFFAQLRAEGLIEVPEDIPATLQPLSEEEREALARRIPSGTPLSQIIIEDRDEQF
jgi:hypothetical protein